MSNKNLDLVVMIIMFVLGSAIGSVINEFIQSGRNHNTQEQCEYGHNVKCVNAWIKESMQNPKSKGLKNE